ncbi:MAG: ferrous-iron efflux pump FieF [Rhodospirillaceae bacterium]|jgi:ferrous-iron efflux pump FieF|nr:ferrous-iron efflux pump FieF [Rhodospirillaceae bacterium]
MSVISARPLDQRGERLMRLATYASVATAVVLIAAKLVAYLLTDSVSLLSTLIDSLLDVAASLVNLFAVRTALMPADAEHRFGHGKAEPIAALGQSAFIAGSALFLLVEAGNRVVNPSPIQNTGVGLAVMLFSIAATALLVAFQRYVIRRTGSVAIRADSLHYVSDLLVNMAVILALLAWRQFGWPLADPIFAAVIGCYILWTAWQIVRGALDLLMDHELPDSARRQIRGIALSNPVVRALHDLRTRSSGNAVFIQFHLELDGDMPLTRAHAVSDEVEDAIRGAFPGAEVIIHQDPAGLRERRMGTG